MSESKSKLGLYLPTDPRWVNLAEISLEEILTDHAYCEQKATTSCISLIQKYPNYKELVKEVAEVKVEVETRPIRKREGQKRTNRNENLLGSIH